MPPRTTDLSLGSVAMTLPLWAQSLTDWLQLIAAALGVFLVGVRLILALRE